MNSGLADFTFPREVTAPGGEVVFAGTETLRLGKLDFISEISRRYQAWLVGKTAKPIADWNREVEDQEEDPEKPWTWSRQRLLGASYVPPTYEVFTVKVRLSKTRTNTYEIYPREGGRTSYTFDIGEFGEISGCSTVSEVENVYANISHHVFG